MAFDFATLIFDRTPQDLTDHTPKGSYGADDLLRVQRACWALKWDMETLGYQVDLHPTIGWDATKYPKATELRCHLDNVMRIADILGLPISLPTSMSKLSISGANAIERCLAMAHAALDAIRTSRPYAGRSISGGRYL